MERKRPPEIRHVTEDERERAISTITAAFLTDPMTRLWLPPGIHGDESRLEEVVSNAVPPDHVEDLIATTEAMAAHHPDENHWFLPLIGVEPFTQGSSLGSALMKHALRRVDEEQGLAYLESTNPKV